MKLRLPFGYDNFGIFIEKKFDFVDKTLFIKEILDDESTQAIVLTRPRRFGKTSALSMLQYFLAAEVLGISTKGMFANLKIATLGDAYMQHQGKYPVIFVSLKDIKASSMALALKKLSVVMTELYREHKVVLQSEQLDASDKKTFQAMIDGCSEPVLLQAGLKNLCYFLYIHYGVKPWILLDEYDTPLQAAYAISSGQGSNKKKTSNYFNEMVEFMRGMLGGLLKTNPYLERAVLTGILRIARESMFSGLNNVAVYSILSNKYTDHFGFTQSEVDVLLEKSGLKTSREQVKAWYNGYLFGEQTIYNPWSIVNFIRDDGIFDAYWVNTSDNELLRELLSRAPLAFKAEFEELLTGKSIQKTLDERVVFRYLEQTGSAVWSLLLFAGYLKPVAIKETSFNFTCGLEIPNQEVRQLYHRIIAEWLSDGDDVLLYFELIKSVVVGNVQIFERHLARILLHVVSYHDFATEPEAFYHGLMLGFTASLSDSYIVQSNREAGVGRFDILLLPRAPQKLGLVLELKIAKSKTTISQAAKEALAQIKDCQYDAILAAHGVTSSLRIGIGFYGKDCQVVSDAAF